MFFIKHLNLFIKNNFVQLKRKWLSLPLLLFFPILMIASVLIIIVTFISPDDKAIIQIGIVDLDQSQETTVVIDLISETSTLGEYIEINRLTKEDAVRQIDNDKLSVYITFPENFTNNLYEGNPVDLPIIGNPSRPNESRLVKEIIDSVTRHISSSQANILTINHYAKVLSIDKETRSEMLFNQFKDFLLYTIGKDKVIDHEILKNHATASPIHYYGLAGWFIVIMIWLLLFYNFLYKRETVRIQHRMKLYGITHLQQTLARMIVTLIITVCCAFVFFIGIQQFLHFELHIEDYIRIAITLLLHSVIFLECLAIIETIISSQKIRLLLQSVLTFVLLAISGTIIPIIYFPLEIQSITPYLFSNQGFYWLQEIILNGRQYVDYTFLFIMNIVCLLTLIGVSLWKEHSDIE